jgi:alkanesulfonate monooxygenase SsuD/methylene tetrahydromethanopterin reductase-like flavin-dependent oxidoreductase (luciferase family)
MYNNWPIFDLWTILPALAVSTRKIRLGTMVSCIAHRNPGVLAKTAATLDVLSNGRLEFGVGAGVQGNEHTAYGFDFPSSSVRIERLGEALEMIMRLWSQEKASYKGEHYCIRDAVCEPKPLQKPHPPITIGGGGEKMLLRVTAKYADRFDWGFLPSIDVYKRKLEALETHCKTVGRNFSDIEKSCWPAGQILLAQDQNELDQKIGQQKPADMTTEQYRKLTLAATPAQCIERLQVYVDLGVTYFMWFFADLPRVDSLRLFAKEVADKLQF